MNDHYSSIAAFVESLPSDIESVAICGTSYTDTGGIGRVIEQQALELVENGYDVGINTLTGEKDPPDGATLNRIGHFERTPYKELDKLLTPFTPSGWRCLSRLGDVDLVITHRFPFSMLSYLASRSTDTSYVFWSHPSQSSDDLFDGVARVWARLQHHMETGHFTVRNADYTCAVSEESRQYIASKTGREAIYVPNNVPDSRFSEVASAETIEERFDIDPKDTVVLHVGRITPRKSIDKLVESFEAITDDNDAVTLVLVGKETMDDYSETVRDAAGDNVILTGFVNDETLAGFYDRSSVYATCSLSEGWGLPLSEANRFETTIVAYDSIPAVRSIENAFLAEDGDQADFQAKLSVAIDEAGTSKEADADASNANSPEADAAETPRDVDAS